MKKKNKYFLYIIPFFITFVIMFFLWLGKINIGLFIDRLGITKNSFLIDVDKSISSKDLFIYWFGEPDYYTKENEDELNRILIYHRKFQSDIIDSYGGNRFLIKYKDTYHKRMGIFKSQAYSKHNYKINMKLEDEKLIIDWSIKNWYDSDIYQGLDTVKIY
jgi:hypothetical protein